MQQQGGGAGADSSSQLHHQQHQLVEEASPISSRPPAAANLEDFMRMSSGGGDEGGGPSGNRWPRQETLALLKIRSDMDAVFRDATVKGPLWEDVSRKLGELGYRRSAKKCKEKFENVHKYYKRTKEGRAGRQDGKTYKFFTELEAFHSATASATPPAAAAPPPLPHSSVTLDVAPVSVGIPMPASSSRLPSNPSTGMFGAATQPPPSGSQPPSSAPPFFGVSFSSDSSAGSEYSQGSGDEESEDERETDAVVGGGSRKRKRSSSTKHSGMGRMMEFFEGLMKQVMQKQELMQQRFLEAIEKREQERMVREEAWKRQETARLAREHELTAQERAIAASRDAAIVTFLQKITGQTIQLPTATVTVPTPPPPAAQPSLHVTSTPPPSQPPPPVHQQQPQQQQMIRQQHHRPQSTQVGSTGAEIVMAVPEQQVPPTHEMGGTTTATTTESPLSSRWPKAEVLALIKIRSGLEPRYQEAGPKGPLWEDISAAMLRQGFKRNAKRCKEKWENINKYYKKVKESNKNRPEDAKTCPYFHELDALYRQKILGGGTSTSAAVNVDGSAPQLLASDYPQQPSAGEQPQQQQQQQQQTSIQSGHQRDNQNGNNNAGDQATKAAGSLFVGQGSAGQAHNKPEDLVRELMMEQQHIEEQGQPPFSLDDINKMEEGESENMDEDDDEEDDDDETDEERKMEAYKIEFQRQKGGGNSFLAMVHQ